MLERWRPELRLWSEKNGRCGRFADPFLDSLDEDGEEDKAVKMAVFDLLGEAPIAGDARRPPWVGFGLGGEKT